MTKFRRMTIEAASFLALSCTAGLAFNEWRYHRGEKYLLLSRNYFPPIKAPNVGEVQTPDQPGPTKPTTGVTAVPDAEKKPLEHDFQTVTLEQAHEYFEQADTSIAFIDARDDDGFRCHIPGAVQFNYYQPDPHIQEVLDAAEQAGIVIVYCNGGACEDSILTAGYLTTRTASFQAPLKYEQIYVFEGGIQTWFKAGYPLEPEGCKP